MRNRFGSTFNLDTTVVGLQGEPISATPPASGQALVFDGTEWVPTTVQTGGGTAVTVSDTAPTSPTDGDLWWDTISGQLFIWYVDANSSQWVVANVSVGVPGPAGPNVMPPGVTDGSNAAAGQVGEYILVNIPSYAFTGVWVALPGTLALSAGDWDVEGYLYVSTTGNSIFTDVAACQLLNTQTNADIQLPPAPGSANFSLPVGATYQNGLQSAEVYTRLRWSSNAAMNIVIWFYASNNNTAPTNTTVSGWMVARRMR